MFFLIATQEGKTFLATKNRRLALDWACQGFQVRMIRSDIVPEVSRG